MYQQHSVPMRCCIVSKYGVRWRMNFLMGIFVGSGFMWVMLKNPSSRTRTRQLLMTLLREDMKSWDVICKAVNITCQQTQQVDETAKIVGVSRREVLEALGFSDEWVLTFDDD